jgi:hypothetical protein
MVWEKSGRWLGDACPAEAAAPSRMNPKIVDLVSPAPWALGAERRLSVSDGKCARPAHRVDGGEPLADCRAGEPDNFLPAIIQPSAQHPRRRAPRSIAIAGLPASEPERRAPSPTNPPSGSQPPRRRQLQKQGLAGALSRERDALPLSSPRRTPSLPRLAFMERGAAE